MKANDQSNKALGVEGKHDTDSSASDSACASSVHSKGGAPIKVLPTAANTVNTAQHKACDRCHQKKRRCSHIASDVVKRNKPGNSCAECQRRKKRCIGSPCVYCQRQGTICKPCSPKSPPNSVRARSKRSLPSTTSGNTTTLEISSIRAPQITILPFAAKNIKQIDPSEAPSAGSKSAEPTQHEKHHVTDGSPPSICNKDKVLPPASQKLLSPGDSSNQHEPLDITDSVTIG
ncbi:hypothetical protein BC938DRAFT_482123 [Jimgerdemannia flammicorona]|uniref:Zn(2)-C6 fungal-type domain-containing protein n=1 Tax=Jimgerdemannia flammicorona TaxID=994334 RepID=A0A433QEK6_9FUNG|nr:hypothetical protein BC938DRAFT_482123 [Jimgerdemannia flammicorona]